jgi:hypothetical protein
LSTCLGREVFPEPLLLELLEQQIHGALDDNRQVAVRVRMAHQVPRALELAAELVAGRELHLVACLRERQELRTGRCRGSSCARVVEGDVQRGDGGLHRDGRDRRRHVGSGRALRKERLHLGLRLARRGFDELVVGRLGERIPEERHRREREVTAFDPHEQLGEATREPGRLDAPERFVLGHAQRAQAELEHGRTCRLEMQSTLLHLDEVGEQAREHHATSAADCLQAVEQLRVGEVGELHAYLLHLEFSRPWTPRGRAIARQTLAPIGRSRKATAAATSAPGWPSAKTSAPTSGRAPRIASRKIDGPDRVDR